ncbi:hypothetical protein ASE01_07045 [Nocardioides sp. Root190]|uniref:DUF6328 family protein n=1 Tax=Nocardioides sp. Root190 TaxID=1736488 RepID=UPI0006FC9CFA|nr:DUF6328 family protein [Nocardioides sp. Root190]KRB77929.1 hypothetical protein ASE01_07045 [Nocardioides sp. Root190]
MTSPARSEGSRPPEQLNRNLAELLQELRVMQTGVQILTGFLLTVPFTQRFEELTGTQHDVYLGILVLSVLTTLVIVAPVSYHRALFRQGERDWLVSAAHLCCIAGLVGMCLVSTAVVFLVFDVVSGGASAMIAAAAVALASLTVWAAVPFLGKGS